LKSPTNSFFFRIHADDRLACGFKLCALFGNVLELRIALGRRAVRLGAPSIGLGRVGLASKKILLANVPEPLRQGLAFWV